MKNKFPQIVACLIFMLIAAGCGRNSAPQKTPEPVVVTKHTRDTIYLTNTDFAIGDDCSEAINAVYKTNALLEKCEKDVTLLLADNEKLKDQILDTGKKVKIKNSYNVDNREITTLRNSNQQLAKDNAALHAENAKLADKLKEKPKEVTKTDNSVKTKQKTKTGIHFWWLIIAFAGGIGSTKLASWVKKKGFNLPFPIGAIINFIA